MFGNLGVHVIEFPSKRFGFVGTLPAALGTVVPASTADVMGGRAFRDPGTGEAVTVKFPSFETRVEAIEYAELKGVSVR